MAIRGETIGRAYVRILADGAGLPQSIKEEMDNVEPVVKSAGGRHGKAYADEFEKRASQEDIGREIRDSLDRAVAKSDVGEAFFNSRNWKRFIGRLHKQFGDAGIIAGHELETKFAHNVDGIGDAVDGILPHIDELKRKIAAADPAITKSLRDIKDGAEEAAHGISDLGDESDDAGRKISGLRNFITRVIPGLRRWGSESRRTGGDIRSLSDVVGKAFGRGSRNNFLNFIGGLVGGLSNLIEKIPGVKFLLGDLADTFKRMDDTGEGFFKSLTAQGEGASGALATLAKSGVGLALAFAALIAIVGPLVAIISGLAAALVALAGSLAFAASAGVAVLIGGLGILAGAAGLAVLAISGLTDEMKKSLKEAAGPLVDTFHEFGREVASAVVPVIEKVLPKINDAFRAFLPLIDLAESALQDFVRHVGFTTESPAFVKFVKAFTNFLPTAVFDLGRIFNHVFRIIFGLIRSTLPITSDFLGWLKDITREFATWINNKGQKEVRDFLSDAADSAKVVGDLIKDIGRAIGRLLSSGKGTGDSIFESLDKQVEKFIKFLDDHPDAVKTWFENGKQTLDEIGNIVDGIAGIIDALDNPATRNIAHVFLQILSVVSDIVGKVTEWTSGLIFLSPPIAAIVGFFKVLAPLVGQVAGFIGEAAGKIGDFFGAFDFSHILDFIHKIGDFFSNPFKGFSGAALAAPFSGAADKILKAIGKINLLDIFIDLAGLAAKVIGKFPSAGDIFHSMGKFSLSDIMSDLTNIANKVFNAFPSALGVFHNIGKFSLFDIVRDAGSLFTKILNLFPTAGEILAHIGEVIIHVAVDIPSPFGSGAVVGGGPGSPGGGPNIPTPQVPPHGGHLPKSFVPKTGGGRPMSVGPITIVTPTQDPAAVATELLNQLAATAYF